METKCFVCEKTDKTDKGLVFLKCMHEGKEKFVCVRCLPVLIHGAH